MQQEELKRAERAVEKIRERAELAPEITTALESIVEAVRKLDGRLSVLEGKGRIHPTAEMSLPNRR
jgi:predicted fused transcriptional regulator/phosphomethylpyrimidine kinase